VEREALGFPWRKKLKEQWVDRLMIDSRINYLKSEGGVMSKDEINLKKILNK